MASRCSTFFPLLAKQNGAKIIEVNPERYFPNAEYYIEEKAGIALSRIVDEIKKIVE